jgi:hypothetical protein
MNIDWAEREMEYFMARAKCACGVLDTLGFAETNCNEPKSVGCICNIGHGKYRLPLAEILILRPGDQNLTLLPYFTRLWFLTEIVICLQRLSYSFITVTVVEGPEKVGER